jgi:monoamine oxidase
MSLSKNFIERDFCVVGAGFAGLTAALRLTQAGYSVIVVEARDRIGGKVWTKYLADGTPIDLGGTFLGPTQDRIYALLEEMGLEITPTPIQGDSLLIYEDKVHRYGDEIPDIDSQSLAGVWEVLQLLSKMSQEVPNEAPWTCTSAKEWDVLSLGQFINDPSHALTEPARAMLRTLFIGLFTCELSEVSLLYVLFQIATSGNDIEMQMKVEGGAEQDMVKGGMICVAEKMKEKIGDCFLFSSAVRQITQDQDSVTVISDKATIKAKRVVIAVPPNLASDIEYTPPLPSTRMELLGHMPAGQCTKFITVYDEPFWRKDGLSGEATAPDEFIQMTLDTSPPDLKVGALMSFSFAKEAILMAEMSAEERKKYLLDALVRRFGARAGEPMHYFEHDWFEDRWTRGCHVAHLAPGVLTSYGHVIREPFGLIHWATSESSPLWNGNIDGAVRAGEYVAQELISLTRSVCPQSS